MSRSSRSKSSKRWLKEHFDDPWVARAQAEGYRSRASFKLLEIHEKDKLFKPGMNVLDLGAAPGGWSQVAARILDGRGTIVASDILPMDAIADVRFLQGDFREEDVYQQLLALYHGRQVDLVMSDMAPNMTGNRAVDLPRAMYLCELALDMAKAVLQPEGRLLIKAFQGEGFDQFRQEMNSSFTRLVTRKPAASRPRSPEVYLLGSGLKMV